MPGALLTASFSPPLPLDKAEAESGFQLGGDWRRLETRLAETLQVWEKRHSFGQLKL